MAQEQRAYLTPRTPHRPGRGFWGEGDNMIHNHQIFPSEAEANAAVALLDDGEDLTYQVVVDPAGTGKAIIRVYDMDGEFIHNF